MVRIWEEYASKKAECKRIAKTAAFNLYRKAISGCMSTWSSVVHDKKLAEREMAAKNSHVLLRIIKRPMVICFDFWKEWYEGERKDRTIVHRISYRWRNANVVLCFRNWLCFVDSLVEERRETLRAAVLDAIRQGNLLALMQEAKRQQRRYLRGNLEDVMKEVLAEEDARIQETVAGHPARQSTTRKQAAFLAAGRSHSFNAKRSPPQGAHDRHGNRPSRYLSPPRRRVDSHAAAAAAPAAAALRYRTGEMNGPLPQPAERLGPSPSPSLDNARGPLKQILPAYLTGKGGHLVSGKGGADGSGRVVYETMDSRLTRSRSSAETTQTRTESPAISLGLDIPAPQFAWDGVPPLGIGGPTAFPLVSFDTEMPRRSFEEVRETLNHFQALAGTGRKKSSLFPAIRQSRTAWPQIDDREDLAVGMSASISDARPDAKLPRIVPAPIAVPIIVDD